MRIVLNILKNRAAINHSIIQSIYDTIIHNSLFHAIIWWI